MRTGRSYIATAFALGIITVSGCAVEDATNDQGNEDWGDADKYPELGGAYHTLTALNGTCAWNATTGVMTVSATANADQTIVLGLRADNIVTVNGALCAGNAVTKTALKNINVAPTGTASADTGAQVVIVDFLNGYFASGVSAGAGIKLNLGGGTGDELRIRTTSNADTITLGTPKVSASVPTGTLGVGTGADSNRDIDALGVDAFALSLGGGNDVLTGAGGAPVGAASTAFTVGLTVHGGAGNDTITGGSGADTINAAEGDDVIAGGDGADTLNGGLGNDTINQGSAPDGADAINCGNETPFVEGAETDHVTYASRTLAVNVTLAALTGTGNDGDIAGSGEQDDIADNCEIVTGGSGNDELTGDAHKNVLNGGAGNDTLVGGLEADELNGGAGDDTFSEPAATSGADTFNGGAGTDTVDYSARTVAVTVALDGTATSGITGSENDTINATDVENAIGGTGGDTFNGNALDNVFTGGDGADTLNGGAGNDVFKEGAAKNGGDTFNGDDGEDTVDYTGRGAAITVDIGAGGANDGDLSATAENDNVTATVENVWGSLTHANTLTGDTGNNELTGGAVNDTLVGGDGNDTLDGGSAGTDTLTCGEGNDLAFGFGTNTKTDCEL